MLKQFLLSFILLTVDVFGMKTFEGEADAFLFAGLFFLTVPFFMEAILSLAPKQN